MAVGDFHVLAMLLATAKLAIPARGTSAVWWELQQPLSLFRASGMPLSQARCIARLESLRTVAQVRHLPRLLLDKVGFTQFL